MQNFSSWSGTFSLRKISNFLSFYNFYIFVLHIFMVLLHHSDTYFTSCGQSILYSQIYYSHDVLRDFAWKREQRRPRRVCASRWNTSASKSKRNDFHEGIKKKSTGTSRSEIAAVNFASAPCYKRTS